MYADVGRLFSPNYPRKHTSNAFRIARIAVCAIQNRTMGVVARGDRILVPRISFGLIVDHGTFGISGCSRL